MAEYLLHLTLESAASFSRGDGTPGIVDREVTHDELGLPFLGGRALKGLLHAEAAAIVNALVRQAKVDDTVDWQRVAEGLFGRPGSEAEQEGALHVGHATLPQALCAHVAAAIRAGKITPQEVLETLTALRHQSAEDEETGAPLAETLRTTRVILRETPFEAALHLDEGRVGSWGVPFLAACTLALRHAGSNKTRGFGRLRVRLHDAAGCDITETEFQRFKEALL